jgi:hypothetical protein
MKHLNIATMSAFGKRSRGPKKYEQPPVKTPADFRGDACRPELYRRSQVVEVFKDEGYETGQTAIVRITICTAVARINAAALTRSGAVEPVSTDRGQC